MQVRVVELQIEQKDGRIFATSEEYPQMLVIAANWQHLALDVQTWIGASDDSRASTRGAPTRPAAKALEQG